MANCPICGKEEIVKPFGTAGAYYACPDGHQYLQGGTGGMRGSRINDDPRYLDGPESLRSAVAPLMASYGAQGDLLQEAIETLEIIRDGIRSGEGWVQGIDRIIDTASDFLTKASAMDNGGEK